MYKLGEQRFLNFTRFNRKVWHSDIGRICSPDGECGPQTVSSCQQFQGQSQPERAATSQVVPASQSKLSEAGHKGSSFEPALRHSFPQSHLSFVRPVSFSTKSSSSFYSYWSLVNMWSPDLILDLFADRSSHISCSQQLKDPAVEFPLDSIPGA